MAKFRGSQGSVSVGGNAVAEVSGWEFTPSRPIIDATDMGDSAESRDLDIPGGTGRITARFDYGGTAQAAMFDQVVSNTTPSPLAFLGIVESGGPKQISANILVNSVSVRGGVGQGHFEATFDFVTDGAISVSWT